MKRENSLVIAEGKILHMGEGVLAYIDSSVPSPFAYPAGRIRRDELVLFVSRKLESADAKSFETIGITPRTEESCVLFLGAYNNPEVQPVEKYGAELFRTESRMLLDTFFSGNDIRVEWQTETERLLVQINHQAINCSLAAFDDQLILFGEGGIRYFRDDSADSRRSSVRAILEGMPYDGYLRNQELSAVKADSLFPAAIAECIRGAGKTGGNTGADPGSSTVADPGGSTVDGGERQKFFLRGSEVVAITGEPWQIDGRDCICYDFSSRDDILAQIHRESALYHKLEQVGAERRRSSEVPNTFRLWGNDRNLSQVKLLLQKACDTNVTVLLTGESGTGKTFLAKEIHKNSKRREKEFVHVNCAAIPYQLIESELFGYEEGAFTGAKKGGKKGYFEIADGGTIFLDEITELPLPLQGKLLEVIQNRTFYRVGGTEKISINVRLVAATNRDLKEQIAAREFREDLYYRINVFPIELPPLRERRDAILAIVTDILPGICEKVELEPLLISPQALEKMRGYDWPGNVRELENLLEKAAIMSDGSIIMPEDIMLPEKKEPEEQGISLKAQKERCEKQAIIAALKRCGGDKGQAARYLDIGRTNLFEKMRKYGIGSRWTGGQDDTE